MHYKSIYETFHLLLHCCAWFPFSVILSYTCVLRLCQYFGSPKLFLWHRSRKTYLAHLLQCVFWLALLSMDGMSARGRENIYIERDRQIEREREMGKAYTLTQRGGKGIPW